MIASDAKQKYLSTFSKVELCPNISYGNAPATGASLPPAKEVWGKVMFYTCLSVILFLGEGSASGGLHPGGPITMGYGQRAGSTHPTGMHSSYSLIVSHLVETDICRNPQTSEKHRSITCQCITTQ